MNILYFLWTLPILELVVFPLKIGNFYSLLLPTIYIFYSVLKQRYEVLVFSIPFFLLFSNLGHSFYGASYAELISVLSALIFVSLLVKENSFSINYHQFIIFVMMIIFFASFILSFEYYLLYKGFINGIGLFGIYSLTRRILKSKYDVFKYLENFFIAIFFTTLIILIAYYSKINLNNINSNLDSMLYDQELYQASFFYTNIFYLTTIAVILSPFFIQSKIKKFPKILFLAMTLIIIFGISVNFNKTALVTLIIIGCLIFLKTLFKKKTNLNNVFYLILLIGFFSLILNLYFLQEQASYRSMNLSSLNARFSVLKSALNELSQNLEIIFIGFGPEALFRLSSNEVILNAKTSSSGREGALDSAYLSYIFEYGIIFTLLFFIYVVFLVVNLLFVKSKNLDPTLNVLSYFLGLSCLSVIIIATTQVLGVGKISAIVFQIFACSEIIINKKNQIKNI